ncbi:MAG: hypothetical protein ACREIA_00890 [Opitutaceae bacterium]
MPFPLLASPIKLLAENPRYFEWRGEPRVLVTSAEHYGAVLNADFDFVTYLAALERDGMNYTRVFTGSYVEPQGAFGIERNTLAPAPGRFLAPWARSESGGETRVVHYLSPWAWALSEASGYAGGGNKFDLTRLSPDYIKRLKAFLTEAGKRGIVVELTLFSSTYGEAQWAVHPLNPANNIQAFPVENWKRLHTTENSPEIMAVQERLVRGLVRELNGFDNLFFEIQNEPWSDGPVIAEMLNPLLAGKGVYPNVVEIPSAISVAWQRRISFFITDEESRLPNRHLIAQNVSNFRLAVREDDLAPETSIVNFHYAHPEAVAWNRGLPRVIGYDESGFSGRDDATYRRAAWRFLLAGGGLFNNLDYSFSVGHENGDDIDNNAPGGGSPALRRQLAILSDFIHGFDLANLDPDHTVVLRSPGVVALVLSVPGKQYALHLDGRGPTTLELNLPRGKYHAEWIAPLDGRVVKEETVRASRSNATSLASPDFETDIALRVLRQ